MHTCTVLNGINPSFEMKFPRVPVVGDWVLVDQPKVEGYEHHGRHYRKVTRVVFVFNDQPTIHTGRA